MTLTTLPGTTVFAALPPRDLAAMAARACAGDYPRGTTLFRAGDPCATLAIVQDGVVHLCCGGADGSAVTIGIVRVGKLLGVAALRGAATHDHDAVALSRVRTVEVPVADLLALGQRSPALLAEVVRGLLAYIEHVYVAIAGTGAAVPVRLLHLLRSLAEPPASGDAQPAAPALVPLALRLSHADLARLLGADRATITRTLQALAASGLVRLERGHVVAVAPAGDRQRTPRPVAAPGWFR